VPIAMCHGAVLSHAGIDVAPVLGEVLRVMVELIHSGSPDPDGDGRHDTKQRLVQQGCRHSRSATAGLDQVRRWSMRGRCCGICNQTSYGYDGRTTEPTDPIG
jgi:hypothetical protein